MKWNKHFALSLPEKEEAFAIQVFNMQVMPMLNQKMKLISFKGKTKGNKTKTTDNKAEQNNKTSNK